MPLGINSAISFYYQEPGVPLVSYLPEFVNIALGQMVLDSTNGDLYICSDNSDQEALVWNRILREDQLLTRSASYDTPVLNTAFQISETRDAMAIYSFQLVTDDELEFIIADDELMSVNSQLVSMIGVVGISSISGFVPAGKWCQLVTVGSPSMATGQVVLL